MRYVDCVLEPGESIRHVTTVSRAHYLPGLALWLVAAAAAGITATASAGVRPAILAATVAIFLVGLALLLRAWWWRFTTEVAVTDRRIICRTGFVLRHTVQLHMDDVESVDVDQSKLGRLLNYGHVVIRSGGVAETLQAIAAPRDLRSHVIAM
jgi:membrane protein YdbS with pleckstrin-like domain